MPLGTNFLLRAVRPWAGITWLSALGSGCCGLAGVEVWTGVGMNVGWGGGLTGDEVEAGVGRNVGWGGGLTGVKVESGLGCQECDDLAGVEVRCGSG